MAYQYHVQQQAEEYARQIPLVPETYPLAQGLPGDFPARFSRLTALAREVYLDIAQKPEDYGMVFVDIAETNSKPIRESYRSVQRFVLTLAASLGYGDPKKVSRRPAMEKGLAAFGFVFGKTLEYPKDPGIVDTLRQYFDCWERVRDDKKLVRISPKEFVHHYYRFDYKITADLTQLTMQQWVADEAVYLTADPSAQQFYRAFYERSLREDYLRFDGDYHCKSKRVARVYPWGDGHLILKLSEPDRYMDEIERMPEAVQTPFAKDACMHCNTQETKEAPCAYRRNWTHRGEDHYGCSFWIFAFPDPDIADLEAYFTLLAKEYAG